jgi:type I restriction enzyme R subunit
MATGSGKTFTAISFIYRLIKFAGARRVLFLVDRGNLADQTLKEFQQYASPYNNFKFTEEYIVQRLTSNTLDTTARVCICTIQRLYSMLKGGDLPEDLDEVSVGAALAAIPQVEPIEYNPAIPIETFDIIVTDECHRSIYNLWAQVLEYFDAYLIGLTATPSKQTFGFFNQNLVMEYNHEMAVADGVNANFKAWLAQQQSPSPLQGEGRGGGRTFTPEQLKWLEMIRDHIAANLGIERDDFEYAPFSQHGGLGKVHQLFGDKLNTIIEELNATLAA